MDFGIFNIMQQRDTSKSAKAVFDEAAEQTILAEQMGFDRSWYAEHHFSNYSLCPSPLMMAAHMAGRTKTIRLGTAIVVASLYTPARLMAEVGMVDTLSNGRLDLGIGVGYQRYEFERFGAELDDAREVTGEMMEMIRLGLSQPVFDYQGKHLQQLRSSISCRPIQRPLPPIWYAGSVPDHLRWLARHDQTLCISGVLGGVSRMKAQRDAFEKAAVAEGKDPARVKVGLFRLAFVSKNKKDVEHYVNCALYQQRLAVALKTRREKVTNDYIVEEQPYDEEPTTEAIMRNLPVGDVDTCIEKVVRMIRELKPVSLAIQTQLGDMEHKKSLASMELWTSQVIPGVMKELGLHKKSMQVA
jgi:alkanesulfonate monooxygenase SsuD/methylene tetrahydromethanopterin reductase-like flavin-dependent oxidoreductase (luciferase family)